MAFVQWQGNRLKTWADLPRIITLQLQRYLLLLDSQAVRTSTHHTEFDTRIQKHKDKYCCERENKFIPIAISSQRVTKTTTTIVKFKSITVLIIIDLMTQRNSDIFKMDLQKFNLAKTLDNKSSL